MARYEEPTAAQEAEYRAWVATRPPAVRAVAERFEPWMLYRMKSTGHRVVIMAFGEGEDDRVSLTVRVSAKFNCVVFERDVFGVDPDDLEPVDLPTPDVPTGAMLTQGEVADNLDTLRVLARPDLWVMDETGKAVRKH